MRLLKIITINVFILILLLCCFEFILYIVYKKNNPDETYHIGKIQYKSFIIPKRFKTVEGKEFKKKPIIVLGCSFAYGSFSNKLSLSSKRPVYNYSLPGKGFQNALYILQNKLYDKNIDNPEYIIYVMMSDHIRRMYSSVCMGDFVGYPFYSFNKKGELVMKYDYYPVYRQFYVFYYLNNIFYNFFLRNHYDLHNKYVNAYFMEMNKSLKEIYPNIKFVILIYGDKSNFGLDMSFLEKNGLIVLQTNEITGVDILSSEYQISDTDLHPNEEAWEIIIPALIKELNL